MKKMLFALCSRAQMQLISMQK